MLAQKQGRPLNEWLAFCPCCGEKGPAFPAKNLLRCGACGFHFFLNPAIAVGAVIQDEKDRVLLVRRGHEPGKGMLGLPGGFVDPGETAEEAVRRETKEEVNLEIGEFSYLCSFPNRYLHGGILYAVLDLFYAARVPPRASPRAMEEVDDVLLLPAENIPLEQLAFDSNQRALRAFIQNQPV